MISHKTNKKCPTSFLKISFKMFQTFTKFVFEYLLCYSLRRRKLDCAESGIELPGMFCCCLPTEFDPDFFAAGRLIGTPATANESKTETKFLHTGHSPPSSPFISNCKIISNTFSEGHVHFFPS